MRARLAAVTYTSSSLFGSCHSYSPWSSSVKSNEDSLISYQSTNLAQCCGGQWFHNTHARCCVYFAVLLTCGTGCTCHAPNEVKTLWWASLCVLVGGKDGPLVQNLQQINWNGFDTGILCTIGEHCNQNKPPVTTMWTNDSRQFRIACCCFRTNIFHEKRLFDALAVQK